MSLSLLFPARAVQPTRSPRANVGAAARTALAIYRGESADVWVRAQRGTIAVLPAQVADEAALRAIPGVLDLASVAIDDAPSEAFTRDDQVVRGVPAA